MISKGNNYHKKFDNGEYFCPDAPSVFVPDLQQTLILPTDAFCDTCLWQEGSKFTCGTRVTHLANKYDMTKEQSIRSLFDQGLCIVPSYEQMVATKNDTAILGG